MIEADFSQAFAAMDRALAGLANTKGLYESAAAVGVQAVRRRIESTKTSPDGVAWAPHKTPQPHTLLLKTGALLNSIGATLTPGGAEIAPTVDYAIFLQMGTKNMVARPFMGWAPQDEQAVLAAFADWVNKALS